jgi:thioredoxin:protein disulfide reductase
MNRLRLLFLVFFGWWLALPSTGNAQASTPADEANVSTYLSVDKLTPGSPFRVAVVVDLAGPWHVNANSVTTEGLIPTTLALQPAASIAIDRITYPPGARTKVEWADEPVALYTGRAVILVDGHVNANATTGPLKIEGSLRYQACNDRICIAPKTVPVVIETEIADSSHPSLPVHPEIFGAATAASLPALLTAGANKADGPIATLVRERGWLITILAVFVGGLALNLTPCVYPMIAITVSYFGGKGEQRKLATALRNALIYFLGIVLTYSTLGLAAALTGSLFGSWLQSSAVLVGIAVLMTVLALSMFGLFEIQPPQFMMQKASALSSKAGYLGLFFLGATVGVVAAPCLAPFVVALLVFVGQSGNPWLGWWMFFALASGLGAPYIVLGTFSGLLTRLPKSGMWMVWVKRVFGVALIAVAAWITSPLWLPAAGPSDGGIAWEPYSAGKLQQAAAEHRPAFIDFTAEWCGPCRKMERTTFRDARIIEQSKQFIMLKADLTHEGTPEVEKVRKDFNIWGVPTLVFIGPDGREHASLRRVEYVAANELLDLLEKAKTAAPINSAATDTPDVPPQLLNPF